MTPQSSGLDIHAAVRDKILLEPGAIFVVPTGFAVAIPLDFEIQIRPRSGLAARHGIGLINSPGTIDADYRGEVFIPVINLSRDSFMLRRGDRIAQMILQKVYRVKFRVVEKLDETDRNTGGFGHTGM
jgi:dUTP pyrophosphatase